MMPDQPRNMPDINLYQNKKSFGTGMMDFALLVTNVNQFRHIITASDVIDAHFYIGFFLIIISMLLQILAGIMLAVNCRYDVKNCEEICKAESINNKITVLIFLITAVNVVIPSFGVPEKFWFYLIRCWTQSYLKLLLLLIVYCYYLDTCLM